jgi:hypothetical protein
MNEKPLCEANRLRLKQLQTKEIKAVEDAMGPGDDETQGREG